MLGIRQTMVSPAVVRGRLHADSFATPFRLRNNVSIWHNSKVISTSGFTAMLTLTVENVAHCRTRSNCYCFGVELILDLKYCCRQ